MNTEKIITIYDIAERLKLAPSTISRGLQDNPAVNPKTRKKIFDTANEMGYRFNTFARNLRNQKTNTIGVIVPRLNSLFISAILAGIEKELNSANYNMLISQSLELEENEIKYAKTMLHNRVDGLIVNLAANTSSLDHFAEYIRHRIPLLFVDRVIENDDFNTVVINNTKAGYEVTSHLIAQGCTKIAHLTGSLMRNVYQDRKAGYQSALAEHGIPYDESLVFETDLTEESSIRAAREIIKMKTRPDALFVANDLSAVICMKVFKDAGLTIPGDIAIAGFNNDVISRISEPMLTTVNYPGEEMGKIAARHLVTQIKGEADAALANTVILKSQLVVRASTLKNKTDDQ
ncbi:transcriptional regulator, LacI family [Pedobacter westerhofensis]|uniref:Transcriptional regulator, LacI family n=1 Tax=Pedobacter westerhofensis TaxID=425512 RepID=A0A521F4M4_9SPHI|nr:LacI family DNA-binding transcriptional regulator [Pedobacter westerhofensis]SMO91113.1 transcriptional regulator, LacI family [Pedobacter westerhofensis]